MSDSKTVRHHRVYILGSGPAGLTAGIYTSRAGLNPYLAAGPLPQGQLTTTSEIENFPGFPEGLMGAELMERIEQQAIRFGLEISQVSVSSVKLGERPFLIEQDDGSVQSADALIIATGASPKLLGIPGESEYRGRGVSYCATCDGFFFRNRDIAVIGGGDSALAEAQFLTRFARKVYLCHRRDRFRASKAMQDKIFQNPKIEILWNRQPLEIRGTAKGIDALVLKDLQTGEVQNLPVSGCFVAIGHQPQSDLFKDQLELDPAGYIVTRAPTTETSVKGVFACGDVADPNYRQAIAAAGRGCAAALDAERFLEREA